LLTTSREEDKVVSTFFDEVCSITVVDDVLGVAIRRAAERGILRGAAIDEIAWVAGVLGDRRG